MPRLLGQYVPAKALLLGVSDCLLLAAAFFVATWIRLGDLAAVKWYLKQPFQGWRFAAVMAVCLLCLYYNDLYEMRAVARRADLLIRLFQSLGVASLILAVLYYFFPGLMLGRSVSSFTAILAGTMLAGWRLLVDAAGACFRPVHRVVIAGTGTVGIRLAEEILDRPELNIQVLGFLDEEGKNIGRRLVNPGIVGAAAEVESFVRRERVDRVLLSFSERRGNMPLRELLHVRLAGIPVEDAHGFYERLCGQIMLDMLMPSALFLSEGFRKNSSLLFIKRLIDVVVSSLALSLLSPVFFLVALAIYLESGCPILFRQKRVGHLGKMFQMLKFRSMRQDAEQSGASWATPGDMRITRVGRFLRQYRLDEIPQFINVLRGEMSLVGPRPEQPEFVHVLEESIPYYAERHTVRPGITGWAQIKYKYGSSIEDSKTKLQYDLFYIKHLSVILDLLIILRTIQVVLFGRVAV